MGAAALTSPAARRIVEINTPWHPQIFNGESYGNQHIRGFGAGDDRPVLQPHGRDRTPGEGGRPTGRKAFWQGAVWAGSFAKTCRGHGTNLALLAGVMGLAQDDERIQGACHLAKECGLEYEFYTEELDLMHENSVHITFFHFDDTKSEVWGSSVGGGRILITRINDFEAHLFGENPTMLVRHLDRPGVISEVTRVLAESGLNIGVFRLARRARGDVASATIIVDSPIPPQVADAVRRLNNVREVVTLDIS